jgi:predicted small metal-binding protein
MAKMITCQCGANVTGETDDEVVAAAEKHMEAEHPGLVGKMPRDTLLGLAKEV